jgi:hypothetical protein
VLVPNLVFLRHLVPNLQKARRQTAELAGEAKRSHPFKSHKGGMMVFNPKRDESLPAEMPHLVRQVCQRIPLLNLLEHDLSQTSCPLETCGSSQQV